MGTVGTVETLASCCPSTHPNTCKEPQPFTFNDAVVVVHTSVSGVYSPIVCGLRHKAALSCMS